MDSNQDHQGHHHHGHIRPKRKRKKRQKQSYRNKLKHDAKWEVRRAKERANEARSGVPNEDHPAAASIPAGVFAVPAAPAVPVATAEGTAAAQAVFASLSGGVVDDRHKDSSSQKKPPSESAPTIPAGVLTAPAVPAVPAVPVATAEGTASATATDAPGSVFCDTKQGAQNITALNGNVNPISEASDEERPQAATATATAVSATSTKHKDVGIPATAATTNVPTFVTMQRTASNTNEHRFPNPSSSMQGNGDGVFSLMDTTNDWGGLIEHSKYCKKKSPRNVAMIFELAKAGTDYEIYDANPPDYEPSDPIPHERLLHHTCHLYVVMQDDFQVGWANDLSHVLHYQKHIHAFGKEMDEFFRKFPHSTLGLTCVGIKGILNDTKLVVMNFPTTIVDPIMLDLPWHVTEKQLSLLVDDDGTLLSSKSPKKTLGTPRHLVSIDLGFSSSLCQSRGSADHGCSLGLMAPNLLDGTNSEIGRSVLGKVSNFIQPLEHYYPSLCIFNNEHRNRMFASQIGGGGNKVEATRAAIYDGNEDSWLAPHVDRSIGQEDGYGCVVWASCIRKSDPLFEDLFSQLRGGGKKVFSKKDSKKDEVEKEYILSQTMHSSYSIEAYRNRLAQLGPSLELFASKYGEVPPSSRFFTPQSLGEGKVTQLLFPSWKKGHLVEGGKIGIVEGNMQYECHLQPYISVFESIQSCSNTGYMGGVGLVLTLSLNTNSAMPCIVAEALLLQELEDVGKKQHGNVHVAWSETPYRFLELYSQVISVGVGHIMPSDCLHGERHRMELTDLQDFRCQEMLTTFNQPMFLRGVTSFARELHLLTVADDGNKFPASQDKMNSIFSSISTWFPYLPRRSANHFMSLLAILGYVPIEFYAMVKRDPIHKKYHAGTYRLFSDLFSSGYEVDVGIWRKNVASTVKSAVKGWLQSNQKDFADFSKSEQYLDGVMDIICYRLLSSSDATSSQGLVDLNAPNYIVRDNILWFFCREADNCVPLGNRGIYDTPRREERQPLTTLPITSTWSSNIELRGLWETMKAKTSTPMPRERVCKVDESFLNHFLTRSTS